MREITKTFKICTYDELSDEVKEKVKEDWKVNWGYSFSSEALDSLNAFVEHFGGRVHDYNIDWFNSTPSYCKFDMPEMSYGDIFDRFQQLDSMQDCPLTGYCADCWLFDGFREAWFDGHRDLNKLMEKAFDAWLKVCHEDCEAQYSDEEMSNLCEANDYEFYEDGKIF